MSEITVEKSRTSTVITRTAAPFAAILSVGFAALLLLLHLIEPEFDPGWRFISEYMLGAQGWMMHTAFFCMSLALLATCVALVSQMRKWYGYVGIVIVAIGAAGLLIAGIFRTDPITTGYESLSESGALHALGASLDYTPVGALLIAFGLFRADGWKRTRTGLFVAAGAMLILMFGFIGTLPADGVFGPGVAAGFVGRLLMLSYVAWILLVSLRIARLAGKR